MSNSTSETPLEGEIRLFSGCKTCRHAGRQKREFRYRDFFWTDWVDVFQLEFQGRQFKTCFRWARRGDRQEGMKDIAREIVPAPSPVDAGPFDAAFSKDLLTNPGWYGYFRVNSQIPPNQFEGKTVEYGFNSAMTAGSVSGIGKFKVAEHSDKTISVCIVASNAGGLHPVASEIYLSQEQVDAITKNPPGSITDFSCFVP